MKTKIFNVIKGDVIPPKTNEEPNNKLQFSAKYLAAIITLGGNKSVGVVLYDFKKNRWTSVSSGLQEVIEYYSYDEGFNKWVNSETNISLDTLSEIYNAFDEKDK